MTDAVKLTAAACRAARALLRWSVRDLQREAQVSPNTIAILEAGGAIRSETATKIARAFQAFGVEITNGRGTGARLLAPRLLTREDAADRDRIAFTYSYRGRHSLAFVTYDALRKMGVTASTQDPGAGMLEGFDRLHAVILATVADKPADEPVIIEPGDVQPNVDYD